MAVSALSNPTLEYPLIKALPKSSVEKKVHRFSTNLQQKV